MYLIHFFIYILFIISATYIYYVKDLEMTYTDRRPTDRPTSRDASHLKIEKLYQAKLLYSEMLPSKFYRAITK